jgi:macrolide-specific efflux system membrane fusion protein
MKKLLVVLVIIIAAGVGAFLILRPSKPVIEKEAKLEQRDLHVEFRETGEVRPRNRLEIKPPFAGRIEEILVEEGAAVKKGQVIVWMSSSERAAMVDAARAISQEEYERWQTIYKPTPIVAPMDGFIILRSNEPGQTISAADAILVMADDLIVEANVDETDLKYIKINDVLRMSLDAYPDEIFNGIVEHIAYESTVVSNVTVYTVKIRPVKKPQVFRAGMTATITVTAESKQGAWSIPANFIKERSRKKMLTVKAVKNGKQILEVRTITTGVTDGKYAEVLTGFKQGETAVMLKEKAKEKTKSFMSR